MTRNHWYPLGFFGISFVSTLYTQWIVFFHAEKANSSLHISIGTVLFFGFLLQGMWSPIVGHWSDHTPHALGNKRYIGIVATLPLIVLFFIIWHQTNDLVIIGMMLTYNLLFATILQAFMSMLPSVEPDDKKRVSLTLIGAVLAIVAAMAALVLGAYFVETFGFTGLGVAGSLALFCTIALPLLFLKSSRQTPTRVDDGFVPHLITHTVELLKTRQIVCFILGNGLTLLVCTTLTILIPFISAAVFESSPDFTLILNACLAIGMTLALTLLALLAKKLDIMKLQRTLLITASCVLFGLVSTQWLDVGVVWLKILWLVGFGFLGFIVLGAFVAPPLILASMAEKENKGRQGLLFGLNGLTVNIGNAIGAAASAYVLVDLVDISDVDRVLWVMSFAALAALMAVILLQLSISTDHS